MGGLSDKKRIIFSLMQINSVKKKGGGLILRDGKEFLELGHDQIISSLFQVFRARAEGTYNLYKETRQKR